MSAGTRRSRNDVPEPDVSADMAWKALGGDDRQFFGRTVLLLDDDDLFCQSLSSAIEGAGGACRRAGGVDDLRRLISEEEADFAVLASDLLDDGCRLALTTVRSDPQREDFPIVVLSADPTAEESTALYHGGADLVLKKAPIPELLDVLARFAK